MESFFLKDDVFKVSGRQTSALNGGFYRSLRLVDKVMAILHVNKKSRIAATLFRGLVERVRL